MMLKYAKLTDSKKNTVSVGLGNNEKYYESVGMELKDVEQGYDGNWYLKGNSPEKPEALKELEIRMIRDELLKESDWTQIKDVPFSEEKKKEWALYRQELRDITLHPSFPDKVVYPKKP